jgi:hypothetical protein
MMHDDHISATEGRDGDWHNCFSRDELEALVALCTSLQSIPSPAAA